MYPDQGHSPAENSIRNLNVYLVYVRSKTCKYFPRKLSRLQMKFTS